MNVCFIYFIYLVDLYNYLIIYMIILCNYAFSLLIINLYNFLPINMFINELFVYNEF